MSTVFPSSSPSKRAKTTARAAARATARTTATAAAVVATPREAPRATNEDAARDDATAEVVDLVSSANDDDDDDDNDDDEIRALLRIDGLPMNVVERIVRRAKGDVNRAMELAARALESSALERAMAASLRDAEHNKASDERAMEAWMLDDPLSFFCEGSRFIASCSEEMREILFAKEETSITGQRAAVVEFLSIERKCGVWFAAFKGEVCAHFEKLANEMDEITKKSGEDEDPEGRASVVFKAFSAALESLKNELFTMPEKGAAGAVPAIFSANAMKRVDIVDDDVVCIAGQNIAKQGANEEDVCDLT